MMINTIFHGKTNYQLLVMKKDLLIMNQSEKKTTHFKSNFMDSHTKTKTNSTFTMAMI
jgi:hypothetical protein